MTWWSGWGKPIIVLTSQAVELFDELELRHRRSATRLDTCSPTTCST